MPRYGPRLFIGPHLVDKHTRSRHSTAGTDGCSVDTCREGTDIDRSRCCATSMDGDSDSSLKPGVHRIITKRCMAEPGRHSRFAGAGIYLSPALEQVHASRRLTTLFNQPSYTNYLDPKEYLRAELTTAGDNQADQTAAHRQKGARFRNRRRGSSVGVGIEYAELLRAAVLQAASQPTGATGNCEGKGGASTDERSGCATERHIARERALRRGSGGNESTFVRVHTTCLAETGVGRATLNRIGQSRVSRETANGIRELEIVGCA